MRKPAFIFVFLTVVLDMLALGMVIPVLPKLIVNFSGGDTARGAEVFGVFATVWALMQFISSPILGALSDRFGRRPVILISNFGLGLDYILMALAPNLALAVCRPRDFRYLRRQRQHLLRLYRRCIAGGKTRERLRHDGRGIRARFYFRPRARRHFRQYRSASAILDCRRR